METSGALGPRATKVLKALKNNADRDMFMGYEFTLCRLKAVMVFALHRANGVCVRTAARSDIGEAFVRPAARGVISDSQIQNRNHELNLRNQQRQSDLDAAGDHFNSDNVLV